MIPTPARIRLCYDCGRFVLDVGPVSSPIEALTEAPLARRYRNRALLLTGWGSDGTLAENFCLDLPPWQNSYA